MCVCWSVHSIDRLCLTTTASSLGGGCASTHACSNVHWAMINNWMSLKKYWIWKKRHYLWRSSLRRGFMCVYLCVCYHDWRWSYQFPRFVVLRCFLPFCLSCGAENHEVCGDDGSAWASEPQQTESCGLKKRQEKRFYFYYWVML